MKRMYKIMLACCCLFVGGYMVRHPIHAQGAGAKVEGATEPMSKEQMFKMLKDLGGDVYKRAKDGLQNYMYNFFSDPNVRTSDNDFLKKDVGMLQKEKEFVKARRPFVRDGLTQFFESSSLGKNTPIKMGPTSGLVPKIGVAFAGQGYPGLVSTLGALQGLEGMGLLYAMMYVAAGSTSTWMLARWIMDDTSLDKLGDRYNLEKFVTGKAIEIVRNLDNMDKLIAEISPKSTNIPRRLQDEVENFVFYNIWPKFWYTKPLDPIEFYGLFASMVMFENLVPSEITVAERTQYTLSDQWGEKIGVSTGQKPFPIYTALSGDTYPYLWWEFTPVEVRNIKGDVLKSSYSMQPYQFGTEWEAGKEKPYTISFKGSEKDKPKWAEDVKLYPKQEKLSSLFGIWGSSPNLNVTKLMQAFAQNIYVDAKAGKFDTKSDHPRKDEKPIDTSALSSSNQLASIAARKSIDLMVKKFGEKYGIKDTLAGTYQMSVRNPFKGMAETGALKAEETLAFRDVANSYLVSALPLLREDRGLDFLIIFDTNELLEDDTSYFYNFFDDAKLLGLDYRSAVDKDGKRIGNSTCEVYKDENKKGPRIIRIVANEKLNDSKLIASANEYAKKDQNFKKLNDVMAQKMFKFPTIGKKDRFVTYTAQTYQDQLEAARWLVWANKQMIEDQLLDVMLEGGGMGLDTNVQKKLVKEEDELEHGGFDPFF